MSSLLSRQIWRTIDKRREEFEMTKTATQRTEEDIEERNRLAENAAERQAVEAIEPYHEAQQAASAAKKAQDSAGMAIKAYMETRGLAELDDIEHNLRAVLSSVSAGNERYDVRAMPVELVLKLAEAGCLSIDKKAIALDANTALRMDAQPFHVPAGVSARLHVEEMK